MFDNLISKYHDLKTKRENGEGGFTLIELLVVVVIIGILIAIAIPLYLNYQKGANDKSSQSDLRAAVSALQQCYSENGNAYPANDKVASGGTVLTGMTGTVTLTCSKTAATPTETVNLSDGTLMSFDNASGVVTMKTWNKDGKKDGTGSDDANKYVYKSDAGGAIK